DYHINDRAGRKATGQSALDARENDFALMGAQIEALKQGKAVYKPIYNHDTGFKDPPELIEPNKVFVVEGLHPIYDTKARSQLDMSLYIDIVNEVKFAWKVKRDVAERGWTEEQVQADIQKRLPDFAAYVDPQKADADVILRYEPFDQGLPYLKVKLIQKKGGPFPMITLKKELTLTGSKSGATLKQYDMDWMGSPATVVEMDGEIDMDNMEKQVEEIEANLVGLAASPNELRDAMVKLKTSPGSQNGTGLLQAVIAMKIREVYDKLTGRCQLTFLAPSTPSLGRRSHSSVVRNSGGDSVPTGLVYPSPEEKVKTREADGITLFSTHAWKDDMRAILPATKKLDHAPVMIGVAADSGCGKSTFLRRVLGALGTDVKPGHTAIGDMLTVICLD
ncbi:unnamed protein product, partial [Polarella glacialis]